MLDDIREWISDNLRYILLGVAGLLVLLIIIFAVRLFTGRKSDKEKKPEEKTTETELQTDAGSAGATITTSGDSLKRDEKDVLDLVTRYYTARLNLDYDTLGQICEVLDDKAKAEYEAQAEVIEAYNNLMTYSKAGLTPGSYVVCAYFDEKLAGIDTLVPMLRGLYLVTNDEGQLIVSDPDSHPDQAEFQKQVWMDDDVQALRKDVEDKYKDSLERDPELASFASSIESPMDGDEDGDGSGEEAGDTSGDGSGDGSDEGSLGVMYTTTGVNVREEPSADSTLYATLMTGMQVEVLENLDNGWSRISYYTSDGTAAEGYLMTQYLTSGQ